MIVQQAVALGLSGFLLGAALISSAKDYFPRRVVLQPEDGTCTGGNRSGGLPHRQRPWRSPCPVGRSGQSARRLAWKAFQTAVHWLN